MKYKVSPRSSAFLGILAALSLSPVSLAQVTVPGNLAVLPPLTTPGGSLNGEYWQRPPVSIPTDGNTNPANRIDVLIQGFGAPTGTFVATNFVYLGNDLTDIATWLTGDSASYVGDPGNLDDGAIRLTGFVNITEAGPVSVGTTSDDGSRITIAGLDIVNNDGSHGDATVDVTVDFAAAGLYPVEITYFNGDWTSDNSPDGDPAGVNHSGNPDPSVHGGANFHLRVSGADITPELAALLHQTAPVVLVPTSAAVGPALTTTAGGLKGEYWKRPPVSIPTDGASNATNRIDNLINGFGPADGTFGATSFLYTGNDLTQISPWLGGDAASFTGTPDNLDDGAVRFSGYINITEPGTIRLGTTSDDGSRIKVAGLDIVNNDGSHGDATVDGNVNFRAAGLYPIEITYFNGDWTSDNSPDGDPAGVNHSGNPDPSVHGGANFRLRVADADIHPSYVAMLHPPRISQVVETGGDNEPTDTVTAKWTGQGFPVSVDNEPVPGLVVGNNYSVGFLGNYSPAFVDRNHRYTHASDTLSIPSYLVGGEYIMSGNDNRDNAAYVLDVTVAEPVQAYLLVDNRLGDPNSENTTPPAFGPTKMQWVLDDGWAPKITGVNRAGDPTYPDEIGIDEGADGTINQWYSIYTKSFPAGTFQIKQADNAGQNMYGAVVTAAASVEPPSLTVRLEGGNLVIEFPEGVNLQSASNLDSPVSWTDVDATSPYTVTPSDAAAYFRGVSP